MASPSPLVARVEAALALHGHVLDEVQRPVLMRLDGLRRRVLTRQSRLPLLQRGLALLPGRRRAIAPLRGLYLWGGVGRGKTFLVDEFFAELPIVEKRRDHFHRFMQDIHAGLRRHRNQASPLAHVADGISAKASLLCIDEFVVNDVADAMLVAGILDGLFARGVTLVATSNLPPSELYRGGLQRARFLPAIALIERHCKIMQLDAGVDYRLQRLESAELFLGAGTADAESRMASEFERLADGPGERDVRVQVEGRAVRARREAEDLVWFDFRDLCEGARSAADYIEIARCYHTVFVSRVPVMDAQSDDAARRFISMVDEYYDRGVKLVLSAAASRPEDLYRGERLTFEFRRTASRLHEMTGRKYLAKPHRP